MPSSMAGAVRVEEGRPDHVPRCGRLAEQRLRQRRQALCRYRTTPIPPRPGGGGYCGIVSSRLSHGPSPGRCSRNPAGSCGKPQETARQRPRRALPPSDHARDLPLLGMGENIVDSQ